MDSWLKRLGVEYYQILRPDAVYVWEDEDVVRKLSWYWHVMNNKLPAKYHLLARVEVHESGLEELEVEELWKIHDKYCHEFDKLWHELKEELDQREGEKILSSEVPKTSLLDVKVVLAKKILRRCSLCERRCGVNRYEKRGACLTTAVPKVATYFHHLGEEAPLVPSGTVFFTGCNFRCVYCQNWDISQHPDNGVDVDARKLAIVQKWLRENGARNINWVGGEPTPAIHVILESLRYLVRWNVNVPQLWNSNMYLSVEGMKLIVHAMDIWLPDMKYGNNECAKRYSFVLRYWDVVTRNMKMLAERGENCIIRHLVLPGHLECCTKRVLEWIAKNYPSALVNIMDQYRPEYLVVKYPNTWRDIARRVTRREMEVAYEYADKLKLSWRSVSK